MLLRRPVPLPGLVFFLAAMAIAIAIFACPVVRGLIRRIERLQTTETDGYLAKARFMREGWLRTRLIRREGQRHSGAQRRV
jgi:hypothetical protein